MSLQNISNNFSFNQVRPNPNPNDYAKKYAEENGLSFEEAKAELKEKYGDPVQNTNSFAAGNNNSIFSNQPFGNMIQMPQINPDDYAEIYAEENGLSVEDAKAQLKEQYGEPVQNSSLFPLEQDTVSFSSRSEANNFNTDINPNNSLNIIQMIMGLLRGQQ